MGWVFFKLHGLLGLGPMLKIFSPFFLLLTGVLATGSELAHGL